MMDGWARYMAYPPEFRREHGPTTRACIVHDHIKAAAIEAFGDDAQMINGMLVVAVRGEATESSHVLAIRFKLFDSGRKSHSGDTRQVERFRAQKPMPDLCAQLELFEEPTKLEAGYVLDELGTELVETWLVRPSGKHQNVWEHEIADRDAAAPGRYIDPLPLDIVSAAD